MTFKHEKQMELVNYAYSWGGRERLLRYSATYDRQRRDLPRNADDTVRSDIAGYRLHNRLDFSAELPRDWNVEVGGDHGYIGSTRYTNYNRLDQASQDENSMRNRSVWDGSVFAQVGCNPQSWKLLLGTRYTHNKTFGSNLSSRGTAVYMLDDASSLRVVLGQAYRAPSLFELYFKPAVVTILGNPGLVPEKSRSAEFSYALDRGRFFAQATAYYAEYLNSIYRTIGNFTRDGTAYANVNFYSNAGRITAKGLEGELRYNGSMTQAFVSGSFIHGGRGDSHSIAPQAGESIEVSNFKFFPRYTLSLGATRRLDRFSIGAHVNHYSSMDTLRTRIPAEYWANATIAYHHGPLRHALSVKNLTNRGVNVPEYVRQRVVESMPLVSGRSVDYTVSWRF